jgi:hypothetical protein
MRLLMFLAAISLNTTACGGSVMTAQRTAAPVLLGPVDRVGGHQSGTKRPDDAQFKTETEAGFYLHAYTPYVTASRYDTGSGPAAMSIATATFGKDDCDVHVLSLTSGGWVMNAVGTTWWHDESQLRGAVRRSVK